VINLSRHIYNRQILQERELDAAQPQIVTTRMIKPCCAKTKKRPGEGRLSQRGLGWREKLSGKAMPEAVMAFARTQGLKKSQILEEG
jgi:hypothetical protein